MTVDNVISKINKTHTIKSTVEDQAWIHTSKILTLLTILILTQPMKKNLYPSLPVAKI